MTSSRAPSTEWRLRVLRNGYLPIPVASPDPQDGQSGKKPALKEWSKIHRLEEEDIKGWEQRFPKAQNTGVICGNVVGLDIDVDDSDIVEKIKAAAFRMLGARAPVRIGRAPRALIVYRTKTPFKKLTSREFVLPNGCIAKVEVLGKGQQFVADGIHPMTKLPYTWIGRSLEEVAFDKLPEIDEKAVQEFLRLVDDIMLENGSQERKTILKYESEGKETAELGNAPIDRQTFSGELINDVQHSILPPIMGSIFNKVVRPDVVGALRPKAETGSVIEPKTSTFGVFGRYFKPLTAPDPSYPLSIHPPALMSQHRCDPAITIATVLDSKCCDIRGQCRLIIGSGWLLALRGAMLAKNSASKPL